MNSPRNYHHKRTHVRIIENVKNVSMTQTCLVAVLSSFVNCASILDDGLASEAVFASTSISAFMYSSFLS